MEFKNDVLQGLRALPKTLPSRYFYDAKGDVLFQHIMQVEEYYLPGCELEIIENQSKNLANKLLNRSTNWNIIELGAGDGTKTINLLRCLQQSGVNAEYTALDISPNVLEINKENVLEELPQTAFQAVPGNYYHTFYDIPKNGSHNLILYMGSNIGNYDNVGAQIFLHWLRNGMNSQDYALVAFDLKKHPQTILKAYNDSKGYTKAFNLNLLERINRELGANFNLEQFDHYPYYEPVTGTAYSFVLSLADQEVDVAGESFHFDKYEVIHTEISKKYSLTEIEALSKAADFAVVDHFLDQQHYYSLSLLQPNG
ncbi:MAG: L-histidine N(alpha)-methyltransferase [Cyclobacteriaceae bacterium]|nr:L-histidine N(alpha)-methyltransferase [Cyclobacteriaceae bacterium]